MLRVDQDRATPPEWSPNAALEKRSNPVSARLYKQLCTTFIAAMVVCGGMAQAQDTKAKTDVQSEKPNIVFIMGDDIGMWNIGQWQRRLK